MTTSRTRLTESWPEQPTQNQHNRTVGPFVYANSYLIGYILFVA
jgi:hypothetical protein